MEIKFKNIHTAKDLMISLGILLSGVALFFVNAGLGAVIAIFGLVLLLVYKKGYRADGTRFLRKDLELNKACRTSVAEYLSGMDVKPEILEGNEGGSVRLLVYYNREEGRAFAQLFDYKDYDYHPATEMVELRRPKVDKLLDVI